MATHISDGMVDGRRYLGGDMLRHFNRLRTRRKPRVTHSDDGRTISIHDLPRGQAERLLALAYNDVRLYGLCTELLAHLYPDTPLSRIQAFLDGEEGGPA